MLYFSSYGICLTQALSICELTHKGDLSRMLFLAFTYSVSILQGDVIEDFIFGDLNRWGGPWQNWDYAMPPMAIIIMTYGL